MVRTDAIEGLSMLSFKQFLINETSYYNLNLTEELTPAQKKFVDDNFKKTGRAEDISGHVIPHGVDRITIPLEGHGEKKAANPHPDVVGHLKKHGYSVDDYVAGTAKKEGDKRVFKIGKVLNSTNAPKEIHNTFQNDPARAASKSGAGGLHIVISRHPHDVAGMSTNQGWASCMSMGTKDEKEEGPEGFKHMGGSNQHYLQHDVEQGTHVAYLARSDDPEAKKPLARIALKPFEPLDKSKKTILRPESRTYGTGDSAFEHTVKKWANENFPTDPDTDYNKNRKLYHDAGTRTILGRGGMSARKNVTQLKKYLQHSDNVTPEEIHTALDHPDKSVRKLAAAHLNRNSDNITKALNDPDPWVRANSVARPYNQTDYHPAITKDHLDKAVSDRTTTVKSSITNHPDLTHDHLNKLLRDKDHGIQRSALRHKNTSQEMIGKVLDEVDKKGGKAKENVYYSLANSPNVRKEHVERMINNGQHNALSSILINARHANSPKEEHYRNAIPSDINEKMLKHPEHKMRSTAVVYSDNLSDEMYHRAALDPHPDVRANAMRYTKNQKHHDMGVKDSHPAVRAMALEHTGNPEHVSHALRNETDDDIVRSAMRNPNAKKQDIQHVIDNHPNKMTRIRAEHIMGRLG